MDLVALMGLNVRKHRKRLGLSQEELAFRAGMKRSYVSEIESGGRNPTLRALGRLADALGVSPADLLRDVPDV